MSNTIKARLVEIFGKQLPEKTTSFHTCGDTAVFVVVDFQESPETKYVDVTMSAQQKAALRNYEMLGSFGWALQ